MPITPINEAEAIIDPLWDPALSELAKWNVEPGAAHGLAVRQNWCWAEFEWARRPSRGPALRMRRSLGVSCAGYDRLVLSVMAPEGSVVRIAAETDRGPRRMEAPPAGVKKKELELDLDGATRLEVVTVEVDAGADGIALGWFNWLGLRHAGRLERKLAAQTWRDGRWEQHLKDERYVPSFAPSYGLVLDAGEMGALRRRHDALVKSGSPSPFLAAAAAARATPPESMIQDFVNFWNDSRYNRERDHGKNILSHGLNAAIAGHLLGDAGLLRLAARYALSIGACGRWDDGFICFFPGGTFEHRCFVQSLCAYEVAGILDLAGEMFTPVGRDFLLRRLAEEAVGAIDYSTWKHEYIFNCNQLAWFSPGRVLALAVLGRHWPRVRQYLDIAYRELCESLEHTILPDGGYVEGPTYFRCVGRDAGLAVYLYSRAVGMPMEQAVPPAMRRCDAFGEAVSSTDRGSDVIPICDAGSRHEVISQAIMAGLLPRSAWLRMLRTTIERNGGWPALPTGGEGVPMMADAAVAWSLLERLEGPAVERSPLVTLPDMGIVTSQRKLGEHWVKLLVMGNKAGAGHTHEDKGSFVLEYAGETFALDPGTCDYSHPLAGVLKNCERHNMMVPYGLADRPAPDCPLKTDVKPRARGDQLAFHAEIDATLGWEAFYKRWHRTWDSPSPDVLTVTDDYELLSGEGVEIYWQTRLPVELAGSSATIVGSRGRAVLQAPAGLAWRVEELALLDGVQRRLALRLPGRSGRVEVRVRLG